MSAAVRDGTPFEEICHAAKTSGADLIVLLAIIALIAWLLRRSFIRVYSKAQIALQETLNQVPPVKPMPVAVTLPSLLRAANLE